jgi:hypothetical protein
MRSFIICTSHQIIINRVIKSRKRGCLKYVACMGKTRDAYNILVGKPGRRQEDKIKVAR